MAKKNIDSLISTSAQKAERKGLYITNFTGKAFSVGYRIPSTCKCPKAGQMTETLVPKDAVKFPLWFFCADCREAFENTTTIRQLLKEGKINITGLEF